MRGAFNALATSLASLGALAIIGLVDHLVVGHASLLVHGAGDAIAHALTGFIWVAAARAAGIRVAAGPAIISTVAIDLDHVPLLLGLAEAPPGTTRPVSHGLVTVVLLLAVALAAGRRHRRFWTSAALGVGAHLFRDLARGAVLLWWPLSSRPVGIPYWLYAALTAGLVVTTVFLVVHRRGRRYGGSPSPRPTVGGSGPGCSRRRGGRRSAGRLGG
jgi:hypothetical protein